MRRGAKWGVGELREPARDAYWMEPLRWNAAVEADPLQEVRIFCGSTMDVGEARDDLNPLRDRVLALVALTRNVAWLLLTKRPEHLRDHLTAPGLVERVVEAGRWFTGRRRGLVGPDEEAVARALRRLWVGFTAENQESFDARIKANLATPAAIHFVSYEPALGPLDISRGLPRFDHCPEEREFAAMPKHLRPYGVEEGCQGCPGNGRGECAAVMTRGLDWVIAGGESGHKARPAHPAWFKALRDQCEAAGVMFHFKQHGEWAPGEEVEANGTDWPGMYEENREDGGVPTHTWRDAPIRETARRLGKGEIPHDVGGDTTVLRVGKEAAGHLLDGVEHLEVPSVAVMNTRALLRYNAELCKRYNALKAAEGATP